MLKEIVSEICESKVGRVDPVLATELELKRAMSLRKIAYTHENFRKMIEELQADEEIITRRCLRYNAYQLRKYADTTENNEESLSPST